MANAVSSHVNSEDDGGKKDLEIQMNAFLFKIYHFWYYFYLTLCWACLP